jgi:hypothetical protein
MLVTILQCTGQNPTVIPVTVIVGSELRFSKFLFGFTISQYVTLPGRLIKVCTYFCNIEEVILGSHCHVPRINSDNVQNAKRTAWHIKWSYWLEYGLSGRAPA